MNSHHIDIDHETAEGKTALSDLLKARFSPDATVVVEASDHVISTRLGSLDMPKILDRIDVFESLEGRPVHATFDRADGQRFEGRVVRETEKTGRPCHRLQRQLMCFGEVTSATPTQATSTEPRVREFTVPVSGANPGDHVVTMCHDYLAIDDDGQAYRLASIVTGFQAMKTEVDR